MFEVLSDVIKKNIEKRNFNTLPISQELKNFSDPNSKYVIKNLAFESKQFRKWRITRLDGGQKLQVFNTVAYPRFHIEKPILGVDILWFGTSDKLLALLDYQPLIQDQVYLDQYCSRLKLISNQFNLFNNTKMKNLYDSNKFFSPWVIICRGGKLELERDLNNLFKLFIEDYLTMNDLSFKSRFLNNEQIKKKHIEYDIYSTQKDPADKLFKKFFGDEWTKKFINNFLFNLNNEKN